MRDGLPEFYRGDTFSVVATETVRGLPRDLTGYSFRSQVRTHRGVLIAELAVETVDLTAGAYRLRSAGTDAWPLGRAKLDVERVAPDGSVSSTPQLKFIVAEDVTRPLITEPVA